MCFCIPLVDPGSFRSWGLFTLPWPLRVSQNHSICYPQLLSYSYDRQLFYQILTFLWFDHLKSGYATEAFMKEFFWGGGEGYIPKAIVYFLLPLDIRARDKIRETECTRNCIICLCYQIYFVGSADPKEYYKGKRLPFMTIRESCASTRLCVFIFIYIYTQTHTHIYKIYQGCQWISQKWQFPSHCLI